MTPQQYETSLLALQSYRAAKSDDILEMLAIACVFRNRVHKYGKSYTQILEAAEVSRPWPAITHPVLVTPYTGLLSQVESIYKGDMPDMTANHLKKNGALYFGRVQEHLGTGDFFEETVLKNQAEHGLVGQWGSQHFYE